LKKILILGSEGFIGSHLVQYYSGKGWEVFGADLLEAPPRASYNYFRISRLSPEFATLMKQTNFNVCINAAGSGNVAYSMKHPVADFEANALDVILLLDNIRLHQPACRYIHISSAAVYGNPESLPITENATCNPVSPYGFHKLMSENICKEYSKIYGLHISVVRPFSVYGPGLRKQLIWDICTKLAVSDSISLFGTGNESRDFIHVSDMVKAMDAITDIENADGLVYNLAAGKEVTIQEIANIFNEYYEGKKSISFSGEVRQGDPVNWKADVSKLLSTGFASFTDIKEGIHQYINWFEKLKGKNDG
jgi:UDP-glucose 4-epimerase